ncbi:tetratricopeptide repeat protein [Rhodothermus marinus]|uniref:Tetratricopeptide TPR_2 repeat protein n=1 Tax=Rhodothermus marinus (strain ATCC 43812 / DSM 4252 / R-10) TaxID=518766 RepID=D0MH67_RHOM4|nr:tetratricopeptide repeat protein [Rhodothermus marinus]ACY49656.1 Tetratricopeptide TPR_2 repeat protein [Rhodothermus marinus DSM 4252]
MWGAGIALLLVLALGCRPEQPAPAPDAATTALLAQLQRAYRAGERATALALADSVIRRDPARPEGYVWKAAVLRELGQLRAAESALREALRLQPNHVEARLLLARVVQQQGRLQEALGQYRQALRRATGTLQAAAWLQLGHVYRELGRLDSAAFGFQEALRRDSTLAEAWDGLRQVRELEGRLSEALAAARRAQQQAPDDPDYRLALGTLLVRMGRSDEAITWLEGVLAARPWHAVAHYHLGRALLARGDTAAGRRHLSRAEQLRRLEPLLTQAEVEVARHADALALLKLARRLLQEGYAEQTRQAVEAARALQPESPTLERLLQAMNELASS